IPPPKALQAEPRRLLRASSQTAATSHCPRIWLTGPTGRPRSEPPSTLTAEPPAQHHACSSATSTVNPSSGGKAAGVLDTTRGEGEMGERQEAVVKIACIQMEPVVSERDRNLQKSLAMIEEAAREGARLIVLPELCNSGYVFESRDEAFELAERVPDGPSTQAWSEAAARHGLHLVAGISERAGDVLYNSSVVIGPKGHVGTF